MKSKRVVFWEERKAGTSHGEERALVSIGLSHCQTDERKTYSL